MNKVREYKKRLQVNHTFLINELEVSPVVDLLFERQVLAHTDLERLNAEKARCDKVKLLLGILRGKSDPKSYEVFLDCLGHDHVRQAFVKEKLDKTIFSEQYEEDLEAVRLLENVLRGCLVERDKAELPVDDFQRALKFHLRRNKVCLEVSMPEVFELVTKVFPAVQKKRNKRRNVTALLNCALLQQAQETPLLDTEDEDSDFVDAAESLDPVPLDEVKPQRVATVMREFLEGNKLDPRLADRLEEQDIDGEVLSELDDSLVEKLFPELTMGKRVKMLRARNEALKELQKPPQLAAGPRERKTKAGIQNLETFRTFDTRPGVTDVYEKGHVLPEEQSRPGFLLHTLHKYCLLPVKGEGVELQIAREAVQFAAACMNERANGTIHFGVAGKNDAGKQHGAGEVVGVQVSKQKCEMALTEEIYRAFFPDQRQVAIKVIRDPVFIPVLKQAGAARCALYVLEVDVVPHSSLVTDEAFFLSPVTGMHSLLYRFSNGAAQATEGQDFFEFMNVRKKLTLQREDNERQSRPHVALAPDLNRKLHGLLTGGNLFELTDIYPLLFLSPAASHMTNDYLVEHFNCLKSLAPLAVFDFDSSTQNAYSQSRGLYSVMESRLGQVYKALTTDNFDKNSEENRSCGNKDGVSKLLESIETGSFRSWIFCNGYLLLGKEGLEATSWRVRRAEGCKEAIRFYKEKIPQGKACIVIMLLSRNYDVLLGALEDVFTKFPDQWIILAETEKIAQDLTAEVVRRKYVEKRVLEERSVIGMPWSHVNQSIMNICGKTTAFVTGCNLPSSTGTLCVMTERDRNQLSDLEILSSKQCEEDDLIRTGTPEKIEKKKRKIEIDFYRGKMVSWWNFYFGDHVLRRSQFGELLKQVKTRLNGKIPEDEKVAVMTLLHQRGAGGSTTAREILWELKEEVRCCVIKQITDQTCDQITRFRNFAEQSCPPPPLVLIDNEDEEKVFQLCSQLNEKARREARDKGLQVFCVLIICVRMTEFPKKRDESRVTLGHALPTKEVVWFRTKYQALEERFENKQLAVHPKLLISFNILKESFNKEYKKQIVEEFVEKIADFREKQLLKYIALINSFDPDFQSIPMSCFNPIMCPPQCMSKDLPRLGQKTFTRDVRWETKLSESLNNLLNRTSELALGGDVKAVRIISNNLSREILQYICLQGKQKFSDVMHEFLHTDIFKPSNESSVQSKLVKIMKEILKKRAASKRGRAKFSPIILEIGNIEGFEEAAKVLKVGFEKFDDPMIAQQISRIYIHIQNWELAEKYAKMALNMKPKNSYLCDTHGQVYKERLISALKDHLASEDLLEGEKAREVIDVASEAVKIFRREQKLSDDDTTGYNNCGFFSELRVVVTTLDLCRFMKAFKFDQGRKLHQFLIRKDDVPRELLEELGEERIAFLKNLYLDYEKPMRRLEDEQIQLKEDSCYQYSPCYTDSIQERLTFVHLQECLDTYFGEDSDDVPCHLTEADKCEFRRRRVRRRGGNSLRSIYGLKDDKNATSEFAGMHSLIEKNVESEFCNAFDLKTMLSLTMAQISKEKGYASSLSMERVLDQTLQLYEKTKHEVMPYLEAYLYLVMFHWPTEWRIKQRFPLCACSKIKDVIREWKAAFQNNHPAQKEEEGRKAVDRRKGTTLFFLGQGECFNEIVFYSELQTLDGGHKMGDSIWNTAEAQRRLKKLRGTLIQGGGEMSVTIQSPKGSATVLTIPTSFPIKDPTLWQKSVRFVLGFCWAGPRAFSVTRDDEIPDLQAASTPSNFLHEPRRVFDKREQKLMSKEAVNEFWELYYHNRTERGRVERDISLNEKDPTKSERLQKEKEVLDKKRVQLVEKRTSVLQGPDL